MPKKTFLPPAAAVKMIDARIRDLDDWRGETLSRLRKLILSAHPDIVEEWKWDVPVWACDGGICTGESYKEYIKLTFHHGASLPDPAKLFNSSLEGATRRAIDVRKGAAVNAVAFKRLIKAAVTFNRARAKKK